MVPSTVYGRFEVSAVTRDEALTKLAEHALEMYADTKDPTDVACLVNRLIDRLGKVPDGMVAHAVEQIIREDHAAVRQ